MYKMDEALFEAAKSSMLSQCKTIDGTICTNNVDNVLRAFSDILIWCMEQKEGTKVWLDFLYQNDPKVAWIMDMARVHLKP